jgi:hypothetical protein
VGRTTKIRPKNSPIWPSWEEKAWPRHEGPPPPCSSSRPAVPQVPSPGRARTVPPTTPTAGAALSPSKTSMRRRGKGRRDGRRRGGARGPSEGRRDGWRRGEAARGGGGSYRGRCTRGEEDEARGGAIGFAWLACSLPDLRDAGPGGLLTDPWIKCGSARGPRTLETLSKRRHGLSW